jgi:hypothetical protein
MFDLNFVGLEMFYVVIFMVICFATGHTTHLARVMILNEKLTQPRLVLFVVTFNVNVLCW